jgi:hypothetical protein
MLILRTAKRAQYLVRDPVPRSSPVHGRARVGPVVAGKPNCLACGRSFNDPNNIIRTAGSQPPWPKDSKTLSLISFDEDL